MSPFDGIIVQVLCNGQCLELYDDPDDDKVENERTCHHYIEAVPGATFGVRVMLTTEFDTDGLRWLDAVRLSFDLGGMDNVWVWILIKRVSIITCFGVGLLAIHLRPESRFAPTLCSGFKANSLSEG